MNTLFYSKQYFSSVSETTTSSGYGSMYSSPGFIDTTGNVNVTEQDFEEDGDSVGETGSLETDEYIPNEEYFESDMFQAEINTPAESHPKFVYYGPDPRMKCKNLANVSKIFIVFIPVTLIF
jgi:hypothetical protein